jgi:hypothetical protein
MSFNFTIGRQLVGVQVVQGGRVLDIGPDVITSFEYSPDVQQKMHLPVSGNVNYRNFHQGGKGNISATRIDGTIDEYFIQQEADYYNSILESDGSIIVTTENSDGSFTKYIFIGVQIKLDTGGTYTGDTYVEAKMTFVYSRYEKR